METGVPPQRETKVHPAFGVYVALLAGAALLFFPAGLMEAARDPWATLLWILFIAAANLLTIPASPKWSIDASLGAPVSVSAAVVLSPPLAIVVNFLGLVNEREWRGGTSIWMVLFNRSQLALSAGAAAFAADMVPWSNIVASMLAVIVYTVVNTAAVSFQVLLRRKVQFLEAAKGSAAPFPHFMLDFGLVTLLSVLIVIGHEQVGPLAVLLLALPLWLGYSALRSAREAEDRAEQLAARVRELETLHALGTELLTARDVERVRIIALGALRSALDTDLVDVSSGGEVREGLVPVSVPGAEPFTIGVPPGLSEQARAGVEAIAGLLGNALQRVRLERELGAVERARTALSGQILEEGTRERNRIALQVHDEVLPYLAAAEIQADNVRSSLSRDDRARADELAKATQQLVHDGIHRLREVIAALRRQIVTPGGLREALLGALEEIRLSAGVEGSLSAPDPLPPLPLAVEILVLETVRGCLANVANHAKADTVEVRVEVVEGRIRLEICDDGAGFDPAAVPPGHHGLGLMSQRVGLARGTFRVDSEQGAGTTVHVEVPV
ncbi:MAG TPA: ATP-binding protein [Egibacteraceae bacterium]|nr:ATP-binding protein [Egibacteraceae bacterium]